MKSESIMRFSTDFMAENQLIQKVNPAQLPLIISEKSKALEALSKQVEKAKSEADTAFQAVKEMQEFKDGRFLGWKTKKGDTKEIIQSTQGVIKSISDAQKESAEAIRLSFQFNTELAKASEFLFNLGSFNMATNEAMIQDLYNAVNSKGGTRPQLPDIIKQKFLDVARRLKEQQSILIKQSELEGKVSQLRAKADALEKQVKEEAVKAKDSAIKVGSESLEQTKKELQQLVENETSEARIAAIRVSAESLANARKELESQLSERVTDAKNTAIKTAEETLDKVKIELEKQVSDKANEAKEAAIKTAEESLGKTKNELKSHVLEKVNEAKVEAIKFATDNLCQVKTEIEEHTSNNTREAKDEAIKVSSDNVDRVRREIEDYFFQEIESVSSTADKNTTSLIGNVVKTIKKRIITSYIIGGLGIVVSITTLVLALLNVV